MGVLALMAPNCEVSCDRHATSSVGLSFIRAAAGLVRVAGPQVPRPRISIKIRIASALLLLLGLSCMEEFSFQESWKIVRALLPEDLQRLARESGFVRRLRRFDNVEVILRLLLMHGSGLSLEQAALRLPSRV
jgi:hypothetical protein